MVWYIQQLWREVEGGKKNRETDEEHDENCVDEGFELARANFDRDGKGGEEALVIGYCSSNT